MLGLWWCDVCDVKFAWKSKYDRHLSTNKLRQMASMAKPHNAFEVCHLETVDEEVNDAKLKLHTVLCVVLTAGSQHIVKFGLLLSHTILEL